MINKKGQTDSALILIILCFQAFIIVSLGFLDSTDSQITYEEHDSFLGFSVNIINNLSLLGWGNTLIFAPIEICIIYIVIKLIRGGG